MKNAMSNQLTKLSKFSFLTKEAVEKNTIECYVHMDFGIGGDIWPAAKLFCDIISYSASIGDVNNNFLYDYRNSLRIEDFANIFTGKRVLELGSGNAIASLVLEQTKPTVKEIVVSDIKEHLDLISMNLELNNSKKCVRRCIDWTNFQRLNEEDVFDVVIALEW